MADLYDPSTFHDRIAEFYDSWYGDQPDTNSAVSRLAELAGDGLALELGIGTGRIAIPLAARGVEVHGVEASRGMLAQLRAKPGGQAIPVTTGNFRDVPVDGKYSLVFAVFSTFFHLQSQNAQLRCFENVAKHLSSDGVFVIEGLVLDSHRAEHHQAINVVSLEPDRVVLEATKIDLARQRLQAQYLVVDETGIRLFPFSARFAWPSELDLMARLAGLRLRGRTANWRGDPFNERSANHVSIYEPDPGPD